MTRAESETGSATTVAEDYTAVNGKDKKALPEHKHVYLLANIRIHPSNEI